MRWDRRSFVGLLLPLAVALPIVPGHARGLASLFAPASRLWPRWTANDPASEITVDHDLWDGLLKRHVLTGADGVNRVNYGGFSASNRAALADYLMALADTPVDLLKRPEQFAFWINFYNALTVSVVLDRFPIDSIRDIDISPGLFADGPWDRKLVTVAGEQLSLNDIEHRILRPIWRDPRIHYAVSCASIGCPNLGREAYRGGHIERQLERAARDYVNDTRGWQIIGGRLVVSSIYDWFAEDFGGSDRAILDHLRRYSTPERQRLLADRRRIDDDRYDWRLNGVVRAIAPTASVQSKSGTGASQGP